MLDVKKGGNRAIHSFNSSPVIILLVITELEFEPGLGKARPLPQPGYPWSLLESSGSQSVVQGGAWGQIYCKGFADPDVKQALRTVWMSRRPLIFFSFFRFN